MFFTQENSPKYKKLYPKLLFRDIFKLIGEEWKKLNEKDKKRYFDLEKKSKEIFEKNKEKSNYNYIIKKKNLKKPIKSRTPFMIYLHESKDKIDKNNCILSLKKIGEKWRNISNVKKEIYINKANEDKIRYKNELIEYMKKRDKFDKKYKNVK